MCSDVGGILLNGDPELVPDGRVKGDHIRAVALAEVDFIAGDCVAGEFVETQTGKAGWSIRWIASGSVCGSGQ